MLLESLRVKAEGFLSEKIYADGMSNAEINASQINADPSCPANKCSPIY